MNAMITAGGLDALRSAERKDTRFTREEAQRTANQFEALFVNLLMARMKNGMNEGGFFGEATGSQVQEGLFTSMLAEQVCTKGPGLGIARQLLEDWARSGHIRDDNPFGKQGYGKEATNV